jgi:hypothetical protein
MPARTDDELRSEAFDLYSRAHLRGGTGAIITLVGELYLAKVRAEERAARLERIAGLDRDTIPCGAPEEGGP